MRSRRACMDAPRRNSRQAWPTMVIISSLASGGAAGVPEGVTEDRGDIACQPTGVACTLQPLSLHSTSTRSTERMTAIDTLTADDTSEIPRPHLAEAPPLAEPEPTDVLPAPTRLYTHRQILTIFSG